MSQAYWASRKLASKLLLAGLLLTGCQTQTNQPSGTVAELNSFEKYLSKIKVDYVIHQEKCYSGSSGNYITSIQIKDETVGLYCLMYYEIVPLARNQDYEKNFFLVMLKTENYPIYYVTNKQVIDNNGNLVLINDYLGGK